MAQHTPGPWAVDTVRTDVGRAFRMGSGEMLKAGKGCCIIYDDYPGQPDNERLANAKLIAAAPDMLAALERVLRRGELSVGVQLAVEQAVAKATGQPIPE